MNGIGGIYIHIIIQTGIGNRIAVLRLIGIDVEAQTRRILVLFTDGFADSTEKAKMALKDAARLGVEVYGVSYVNTSIVDLIGEQRSIVIRDIAELSKSLTQMLLNALRRAA